MLQKGPRTLLPILVFAVVIVASGTSAYADTITFSTLEQAGSSLVHISDPYVEGAYRIQNGGELYFAQQSNVLYAGSAGLHERISNGLLTLNRVDGAAFNLLTIDLSILHPNGASPPVVFVGTLLGGGTVTQTFTPTLFGFHTFTFTGSFSNLVSVSWRQGTDEFNAHQFDNIVVTSAASPTPEPSAMLLLGTGLMAFGAKIRKRRRSRSKLD
jgi:PEP-CTERM motif